MKRHPWPYRVVMLLLVAVLTACTGTPSGNTAPTDKLEIISWWTSASEAAALNTLTDAFKQAHSGVTVTNAAVAGGSGSNAAIVLANRLQRGDPPDVWQVFPGAGLQVTQSRDQILDVSSVYAQTGLAAQLPASVLQEFTVDGKQYAVPTSAHRQNVLWFNTQALSQAGVTPPAGGYTMATFLSDLKKVKAAGITPLCLGGKDAFTKVELFENVLLSVVGVDGWTAIRQDRFDWGGAQLSQALDAFGAILDATDAAADATTWDAASKSLEQGKCAFQSMNDSSFGEYTAAGATNQLGYVAFPGTTAYLSVIDSFVLARGAKNQTNGQAFLQVLAGSPVQTAFSAKKGSIPARLDASVSSLSGYQQAAAQVYRTGPVLMSMAHGELMSPAFQNGLYDAVAAYASGRSQAAFTQALTNAIKPVVPGGH